MCGVGDRVGVTERVGDTGAGVLDGPVQMPYRFVGARHGADGVLGSQVEPECGVPTIGVSHGRVGQRGGALGRSLQVSAGGLGQRGSQLDQAPEARDPDFKADTSAAVGPSATTS